MTGPENKPIPELSEPSPETDGFGKRGQAIGFNLNAESAYDVASKSVPKQKSLPAHMESSGPIQKVGA
jgi:hypothetical protein